MESEPSNDSSSATLSRTVCRLCRQRKTKCDRQLPKCGFCIKAKVACQYLPEQKKRGLRAGYVSELESRIEALEYQIHKTRQQPTAEHENIEGLPIQINSLTTSGRYPAPHNFLSETNAAVKDMMSLPLSYYHTLAAAWFKEDQHWAPILEYDEVQRSLQALPDPVDHVDDVVLRALLSLKVAYSSQAICLGYHGRRRLSLHLRSQALSEAMANPSINSIKAMFIIAVLDAGSDELTSTMNIMSMCRRSGEHIGIYQQLLKRIASESPAQVGPPTRDAFASEKSPVAITWAILAFDAVTSLGVSWRDVSAALVDHLSGIAYLSTPDFRDSFRTQIHLCAIGLQPLHEFFVAYARGEYQFLEGQVLITTEDLYQNLMSYTHGKPISGYSILADGAVDFDINNVFTRLTSHAAAIMMYQRYVLDAEGDLELARQRCDDSYNQIVDVVRNISDVDCEINSPSFAHFIAVAARYHLVLCRATGKDRGPYFDLLMHGISMCGRRWPLARRIDVNLRSMLVEIETGADLNFPASCWDLKQSGMDISDAMRNWAHENSSLYAQVMTAPYA